MRRLRDFASIADFFGDREIDELQAAIDARRKAKAGRAVEGCARWEEGLPPGYRVKEDADLLLVLRPDGSTVAAFSALGADPLEVIAAAWEDYE